MRSYALILAGCKVALLLEMLPGGAGEPPLDPRELLRNLNKEIFQFNPLLSLGKKNQAKEAEEVDLAVAEKDEDIRFWKEAVFESELFAKETEDSKKQRKTKLKRTREKNMNEEFWQRITQGSTRRPTRRPDRDSDRRPTARPTNRPTRNPNRRAPTSSPTKRPTRNPNRRNPTNQPTPRPTRNPNRQSITLGDPTFFGSGCPNGSVEVVFSPDDTTLSVLFTEFEAETNGVNNDQSSCQLAVPVRVVGDLQFAVFGADYRGFTSIPQNQNGASSSFDAEYFFAGIQGSRISQEFTETELFTITDNVRFNGDDLNYSPCGDTVIFRINTSIVANKRRNGDDDVLITIDSTDVDVDGRFDFRFDIREC